VVPRVEIAGTGLLSLLMLKACEADGPVVGAGFVTVTLAVPAAVISDARIAAVTCKLLTNVVVRLAPLNWTVAPFTKPVPFTVSVNDPEPAKTAEGDNEESAGTALLTVKVTALEVPPPGAGFVTVTF
jgi:hypothetical protein